MELLIIVILVRVFFGAIAALIASKKGRNTVAWFFGGFLIDVIGIIIVACLPNLKQQHAHQLRTERERRRLREQLRQERLKSEAFRKYSAARLDTHDQALGIDSRSPQAALPGAEPASPYLTGGRAPPAPNPPAALWYYEVSGDAKGPVPQTVVADMLRSGAIGPTTLLWTEGLAEWTPANQIETFRAEVGL